MASTVLSCSTQEGKLVVPTVTTSVSSSLPSSSLSLSSSSMYTSSPNPLLIYVSATFHQETKKCWFHMIGPRDIRDSVRWWRMSIAPIHVPENSSMLKGAAPLDPQQFDEKCNTTIHVINVSCFSGSLWTQPLNENKEPISCHWVHIAPSHDHNKVVPIIYGPSVKGWIQFRDILVRGLLNDEPDES